jgi:hypothetical protein
MAHPITDPAWQALALAEMAGTLVEVGNSRSASRVATVPCAVGDGWRRQGQHCYWTSLRSRRWNADWQRDSEDELAPPIERLDTELHQHTSHVSCGVIPASVDLWHTVPLCALKVILQVQWVCGSSAERLPVHSAVAWWQDSGDPARRSLCCHTGLHAKRPGVLVSR